MQVSRFWIVVFLAGVGIGRYALPRAATAAADVAVREPREVQRETHVLAEVVRCATSAARMQTTQTPTTEDAVEATETADEIREPEPELGDGLTDEERREGVVAELEDRLAPSRGAIQGQIRDSRTSEPLAGVTVIVTSPALTGAQIAITDEQGYYAIGDLPTGDYLVTFYYIDTTVERSGLAVSARRATAVSQRIDTGPGITIDYNYVRNIPEIDPETIPIPIPSRAFEGAVGGAADVQTSSLGSSVVY